MTRKRKAPTNAQVPLVERGILSSDELVAPTPRRDPVECVLEDARDFLRLLSPDDLESHDLIARLSHLLEITHDLLEDYIAERDLARALLDKVRLKSLINGVP